MSKQSPNSGSLRAAVATSWALLLGFAVLMVGDGLQTTLLAIRAFQEGFSTTVTGIVMSSFYAGFLGGSLLTPRIVSRVGHTRVFAALAALASATILVHAVFVTAAAWMALRLASGFCFAGLYVVAESWLNDRASNESRGQVLSIYMVISYVAVGAGQLLLNVADPLGYPLFVLTSVLISIAVVPLLLSATPAPSFEQSQSLRLRELYHMSPTGVAGMFGVGLAMAIVFALGPVYAARLGWDTAWISLFMAAPVLATVVVQWPIGHWSDRRDRRHVLIVVTFVAAIAAFACIPLMHGTHWALIGAFGVFGGFCLPMYSLCIAHTNDHLAPEHMVAASGGLMLAGGVGAILGPLIASSLMDGLSDNAFFGTLGTVHATIGAFAIYRTFKRPSIPLARQRHHAPSVLRPSSQILESIQTQFRDDYSIADPGSNPPSK